MALPLLAYVINGAYKLGMLTSFFEGLVFIGIVSCFAALPTVFGANIITSALRNRQGIARKKTVGRMILGFVILIVAALILLVVSILLEYDSMLPALLALLATIAVTMFYFRKDLRLFDAHLRDRLAKNLSLAPVVDVPYKRGLFLLLATICVIASHHPLERIFGLEKNSILLIAPLICSGIVMIIKHNRARFYVEREVDWWTLVFFMLLFAVAGTVHFTGVDKVMAVGFTSVCGTGHTTLVPFILSVSAVGSAFVDNVIFVAAFSPVIEQLAQTMKDLPLWMALLFGACFGGNITMIGSTANIVALGLLERKSHVHVNFFGWLKIGFISALVATLIAWVGIMALSPLMPDRYVVLSSAAFDAGSDLEFGGKLVTVVGRAEDGRLKLESEHQQYDVKLAAGGLETPSGVRAYRGVMNGDPASGYTLTVEDVLPKSEANAH